MRADVKKDYEWQDQFIPRVREIIGGQSIVKASFREDVKHNTDLISNLTRDTRYAVRLRQFKYFPRYSDEFTIRATRPSGVETELAKIIRGWGDYFFYGFINEAETDIHSWILGDLSEFRLWHSRKLTYLPAGSSPGAVQKNPDRSSVFHVFKISELPQSFIIAQSEKIQERLLREQQPSLAR